MKWTGRFFRQALLLWLSLCASICVAAPVTGSTVFDNTVDTPPLPYFGPHRRSSDPRGHSAKHRRVIDAG